MVDLGGVLEANHAAYVTPEIRNGTQNFYAADEHNALRDAGKQAVIGILAGLGMSYETSSERRSRKRLEV